MTITQNHVVTIHYTLTNDAGETIDTSVGAEPLAYIQGLGHIITGLESQLEGKTKGDSLKVSIKPEDGYGERRDDMVQTVPKSDFQDANELKIGMQFQVSTDQGPIVLTVIEVKDSDVVLDGNHPLAGENLHFDVEVMDVREATKEEIDHGHVH